MISYNYRTLMQEVALMEEWKITALCAVCAEKVSPIVRFLALPQTWAVANKCLEFAWSCAKQEAINDTRGEELNRALKNTPEWQQCEEPDGLPFVVGNILSLYDFALATISARTRAEKASKVGFSLLLETAELFDLALEARPGDEKRAQRIMDREQSSQINLVETIKSKESLDQAVGFLRDEASAVSTCFEEALPVYCHHYVRSLINTANTRNVR
jgi:hypothetical protein